MHYLTRFMSSKCTILGLFKLIDVKLWLGAVKGLFQYDMLGCDCVIDKNGSHGREA